MHRALVSLLSLLSLLAAAPATAELTASDEDGFTVRHVIETGAEPFNVYRTMTAHVDQWWSGDHTWGGDAAKLYMKVERGGCFCERLPGSGMVEHLRIIYFAPGSEIRFDGALGPLQTMAVHGRMIWKIEPLEKGSRVSFTYKVFGHPQEGLSGIAPAVDGVIGEQLARLAKRLNWD
jgi:hypothetical protein